MNPPHRVLGVIPARGGSKGVPGKHLLELTGRRTLLGMAIEVGRACPGLSRLIVSTDDEAIAAAARRAGAEVPFLRQPDLATDLATGFSVLVDALTRCEVEDGPYDHVVLLQPTSPLRTVADVEGALDRLVATGAPAVFSISPLEHPRSWNVRLTPDGRIEPEANAGGDTVRGRQTQPVLHRLNGAVYAYRADVVRAGRPGVLPGTLGHVMPVERSIDVDTRHDLDVLRGLLTLQSTDGGG